MKTFIKNISENISNCSNNEFIIGFNFDGFCMINGIHQIDIC